MPWRSPCYETVSTIIFQQCLSPNEPKADAFGYILQLVVEPGNDLVSFDKASKLGS